MPRGPKPKKPEPDFPLFAHASGQWAKKINGKVHYFGVWADATAARLRYVNERDALRAGVAPSRGDALTVRELCDAFMVAKLHQLESGDIGPRTFSEYRRSGVIVVKAFGNSASVGLLAPADFDKLRAAMVKRFSPIRMSVEVQKIRSIFKYGVDAHLIDKPVRMGPFFKAPSKKAMRAHRNALPPRMFSPEEIRGLIDKARPLLRAAILLGINCGFGQSDITMVPSAVVDLESGWINFPRVKTEVKRRCPLWPETISALKEYAKTRPEPLRPEWSQLFFLTRSGRPLVEFSADTGNSKDAVYIAFRRATQALNIKRRGAGFYSLRHTFQTIAERGKDFVAVRFIMGHAEPGDEMAAHYREEMWSPRLVDASNIVREWVNFCAKVV